jgi:hypothetical protein
VDREDSRRESRPASAPPPPPESLSEASWASSATRGGVPGCGVLVRWVSVEEGLCVHRAGCVVWVEDYVKQVDTGTDDKASAMDRGHLGDTTYLHWALSESFFSCPVFLIVTVVGCLDR